MLDQFEAFLFDRSHAREISAPPIPVVLPAADDADMEGEYLGNAEGQSFMIDYVDSGGRASRRRITVYGLALGNSGIPMLTAKCHERRATRTFRVDRIRCCIDFGGEVHEDVASFLQDNFGMSATLAARRQDPALAGWQSVLDLVRDDAVILAAMSRSDGHVHVAEVDVAVRHLVAIVERRDDILSDADIARLSSHFARLHPTDDAIRRAVSRITAHGADHVQRLLRAVVALLDADGLRHSAEMRFLDTLCIEVTGVGIG